MKSKSLEISGHSLVMKLILTLALLLLAVALYAFSSVVSVTLTIISIVLLLHSQGVEINMKNRAYRSYNSFVGIKSGKWKSLDLYKSIVLIITKGKKRAHHMTSERNIDTTGFIHKIYLVDKNHNNRLLILRTENELRAKKAIATLKSNLKLPFEKYNPVFSEKTKVNRAHRKNRL